MSYETIMLILNVIVMLASVVSCILAINAKNTAIKIKDSIKVQKKNEVSNSGTNSGIMAGKITGGAEIGRDQK